MLEEECPMMKFPSFTCSHCSKEIPVTSTTHMRGDLKFCSTDCRNFRKPSTNPLKEACGIGGICDPFMRFFIGKAQYRSVN